ncbi:MAG: DUF2207 domain-containing protein [Devosia sp.]
MGRDRAAADPLPFTGEGDRAKRGGGGSPTLRTLLLALVTALLTLLPLPALAREVITSFASAVELRADGSVEVLETIAVFAEGIEIRRGIYRDIPLIMINPDNSRLRSNLEVIAVSRDGQNEPYKLENLGNGYKRIRIGDPDVFVTYGPHTYTIRYTMSRMGRSFADHDELFWNATGNYWNFPIEDSVTSIELPPGAVIDQLVGYTGVPGSTEQAVEITRVSDTRAIFRTTRPLASGEGVSVAASFQKGILAEPQGLDRLTYWLSDHRDVVVPGIAVALVLLYNLLAWSQVGRDPPKGTIIPLFHPPKGFSPALAHWVHKMGWEKSGWTAFTAAIFDLGAKGLVKIDNPGKTLTITRTKVAAPADLRGAERVLFNYFDSKGSVTVNTSNGPKLNETRTQFMSAIEGENRSVYFNRNAGYVVFGLVFSGALLLALVIFDMIDPVTLIFAAMAGVSIGILSGIVRNFLTMPILGRIILGFWVVLFGSNALSAISSLWAGLRFDTPVIAAGMIVLINVVFGVLMRAPTVQGRKAMDQLEGFRMYMDTAEKNRLNLVGEPPMTVDRFERMLPYAIALDVEKPWSEHFEAELARNAVGGAPSGDYQPNFYSGRSWSAGSGSFSNTVSSVATGMSAAMIASQPSSSSGSGFSGGGGGGGGSGGGGGGGGGGGW